jgi:hypothetical protein
MGGMLWRLFGSGDRPSHAEVFRRVHERWLTRALERAIRYPRIPIRRVDDGGFEDVRRSSSARARANRWWDLALERVDSLSPLED